MHIIISLLLALAASPALGAVVWGWSILNPTNVVTPHEEVTIHATLHNDITSEPLKELDISGPGEVVDISFVSFVIDPSYFDNYSSDSGPKGPTTLRSQFAGVTINPGDSFQFVPYTLIPRSEGAAPGTYEIVGNSLRLSASLQGSISGGTVQIQTIPLPSALVLLLLPLFIVARKRI